MFLVFSSSISFAGVKIRMSSRWIIAHGSTKSNPEYSMYASLMVTYGQFVPSTLPQIRVPDLHIIFTRLPLLSSNVIFIAVERCLEALIEVLITHLLDKLLVALRFFVSVCLGLLWWLHSHSEKHITIQLLVVIVALCVAGKVAFESSIVVCCTTL